MVGATLINKYSFVINKGGLGLRGKLPNLASGYFYITLQIDEKVYLAELLFNYSNNWLMLRIKNSEGVYIQQDTYVRDYPNNLLLAQELRDYGLFYFPEDEEFRYYKLTKEWYNNITLDYYEYIDILKSRKT